MAVPNDEFGRAHIVCPHCWDSFGPGDALWISNSPDLVGDPFLGAAAASRFLPTDFNSEGNALDLHGSPCNTQACPRCHLEISRDVMELAPLPIAICNGSHAEQLGFMAAMIWQMLQVMPSHFHLSVRDADSEANLPLSECLQQLNQRGTAATQLPVNVGDENRQIVTVTYGYELVQLRRPFQFTIRPTEPVANPSRAQPRLLSLYSFDDRTVLTHGTRPERKADIKALAQASALLFLFDPFKNPVIRKAVGSAESGQDSFHAGNALRPDAVLHEIVARIRRFRGLAVQERIPQPLIIVLTNFDLWAPLIGWARLRTEWILNSLNVEFLQHVSRKLRDFLQQYAPEMVAAAEANFSEIMFVPANGIDDSSSITLDARKLMWVEVPLLWALHRMAPDLIPASMQSAPVEAIESISARHSTHGIDSASPGDRVHPGRVADQNASPSGDESSEPVLSRSQALEHVEFSVYHPRKIEPSKWYSLLAFAHLGELPADAPADRPAPEVEVQRRVKQMLGGEVRNYTQKSSVSAQPVPREELLTFVPHGEGLTFNPPSQSFLWIEDIHQTEFRMRTTSPRDGAQLLGTLSVYLGAILLADVRFTVRISSSVEEPADVHNAPAQATSRPYRKIFASYSHNDLWVVSQFEKYAKVLGDRFLRDWTELRSGELWSPRLRELIDEADVFQLFWSTASSRSDFVEQEWRYALQLQKVSFIRPCHWEEPFPPPPVELKPLHFERLHVHDAPCQSTVSNNLHLETGPSDSGASENVTGTLPRPRETAAPSFPAWKGETGGDNSAAGNFHDGPGAPGAPSAAQPLVVVERLQAVLQSPNLQSVQQVAELSRDFSVAVAAVNRRLLRCDQLLQAGYRIEALTECELEPHLLELVQTLDTPLRQEWDELVSQHGLKPAPELNLEVAAMLTDACSSKSSIGRLLARYHELKHHNAPTRHQLEILRRVMKVESNPDLNRDLHALETRRFREIEQELQDATVNDDFAHAQKLAVELSTSHWRSPPRQQLMLYATEVVTELQAHRAARNLPSLFLQLTMAFESLDVDAGRRIRAQCYQSIEAANLSQTDSMPDSVVHALEWLENQDRVDREKADFESALSELALALDAGVDRLELEKRYHALQQQRYLRMPDDLRRRVEASIIHLNQQSLRRKQRLLIFVSLSVSLAVLITLVILNRLQ